jgi:glutamyl/glutaminyl-tRNA synthetase
LISLDKLSKSWILFDLQKVEWFNNEYLSKISNEDLYQQTLSWAQQFRPAFAELMEKYTDYAKVAIAIERHSEKDPKRFTTFLDVEQQLRFFFDEERHNLITDEQLKMKN